MRAHDPIANAAARAVLPGDTVVCEAMYEALEDADAVVLATEWNEFRTLGLRALQRVMRGTLLLDGRNIFDPDKVRAAGLRYLGVGRVEPPRTAALPAVTVYENEITRTTTRT